MGIAVSISHVEFLGSEVLVYVREPRQGADLILRLAPEVWERAPSRQDLRVTPVPGRLLAFDGSGRRVGLISAGAAAKVQAGEPAPTVRVPRYV
ncbi:MAG: hypothetical protein FD152_3858 [Xanthobacteraceae bacterium]|nr:MAG: hypothetical protein FD152_3858 [Xanthobacteraceae bacterium]